MPHQRNHWRNRVELYLVRALFHGLKPLSKRWRRKVGHALGMGLYLLSARHRRTALSNLDRAFGESRSREEKIRIAKASFAHLGHLLCDSLFFPVAKPDRLEDLAVFEGLENLRNAHKRGKGVFVFSGHYGNWEMVALLQGFLGIPMAMVTRPLDNPHLENLLFAYRTRSGNRIIHKHGAAKGILRAIREGWAVAIVIDQNVRGEQGIFVDFFGTPASTTPALATLALKTGAPIVPAFGIPLPDGRYRIRYLPEVTIERSGDRKTDIHLLTQKCTRVIEDTVRNDPEYWVWVHRRWRTRPPSEKSVPAVTDKVGV